MATITDFLINWGYWGMLMSAFLAGSFFPFSSEVVMLALLAVGLNPWQLIIFGTVGNVLGGLFNYGIGRMGRMDWIEHYLRVKPRQLEKAQRFMGGHGAWMGFFAFVPFLGSAITIALGFMRANFIISLISISMGKFIRYIVLAMSVVGLASCVSPQSASTRQITVSIEPLRYFTEQIVGDRFEVSTLVPAGSNPELYEPTAKQIINFSNSDLFIKVGNLGFERTWMKKLENNAPHTIIVDASEHIVPLKSANGIEDSHTWMSTENAIQIANSIFRALAEIDSKDSTYFRANLNRLIDTINNVDRNIQLQLTKGKSRAFLIYHPALTYFAKQYHLQQIPVEEEGREPSAAQLQQVISTAKRLHVKTLFIQREFANRNTEIVAKGSGATEIEINTLSYHWDREMVKIAERLK
ncbi:zinc ABC transporter substrate-binding protein [Prevotella sp. A2931]|uniref:Zinc ABC transporter substrate-binding protein n=1 Tax=Prevotella illustrans TaxID=2800387 RepID=A0ABS3M7I4_9BACT|nr:MULTISPECIES: zinc ABC transporter substrate-binding protein [Prevotella]MBO1364125.1 zinc ABC transporter substrate-binding protein [Prevotella illustrans]PTL26058.1 ABC transporter substrate-binding protein [Prevotella sp. oral taxon 820]